MPELLKLAAQRETGATVFAYQVANPERYGVVWFDNRGAAAGIEEKPQAARSNWALTGLYFFDNDVLRYAAAVTPSPPLSKTRRGASRSRRARRRDARAETCA